MLIQIILKERTNTFPISIPVDENTDTKMIIENVSNIRNHYRSQGYTVSNITVFNSFGTIIYYV
jgi:predicted transport protein